MTKFTFNDLTVLAVENKHNDLFSQTYKYPFGRWSSKLLPLAVAYIDFIGTTQKSAEEFSESFYRLASNFKVRVADEETSVTISGLHVNYSETMGLLHDLLKNCTANLDVFKHFIANIKKSREEAKMDKDNIMSGLLSYAKYGAKNPFDNVLTSEELEALKEKDLIDVLSDLVEMKYTILYYGPHDANELVKSFVVDLKE